MSLRDHGVAWLCASMCAVWPSVGLACSVCFDATSESQQAFIGTTIFLSLFPLMLIGGGAWWVSRKMAAANPNTVSRTS